MEGFEFQVEVKRTDRKKSASLSLDGDLVKVTVPRSLSNNRIRDLINKRSPWIKTKLKEQSLRPSSKPKEFVSGETVPYLGKNYRLKVIEGEIPSIKMVSGYLVATVLNCEKNRQDAVRYLLEDWYQRQAKRRLKEKTERLSKIVGISPTSVSVKSYKSRWGSCSSTGALTYNWRIVLAPHRIVDYVVVHELCHLLEHNHSPRYWRHVEYHVPDWRDCREWLKGQSLMSNL
ncbi:M48 family metallopeptidase [Candidatus Persebacteraceae bacterium Df01]|jgi:predicted metal-dependent hydrolase|uniref:M48 family metallopeptidase n=1 Tax=Candidatus Doriopsillibacter californiensis TaxID=2970740 RepID=A0ABT7QNC8_9GAMM|nr:M48 family metallopeptidase [Candidatus Persebacteraceae bacterium Df01]